MPAHADRQRQDELCWSRSPVLSDTNSLIHGIFWLIIKRGRVQTEPHLTRISSADFFFYESLFVVAQETVFIGGVRWHSSSVVLYKEQPISSLFSPHNSAVPARAGSGGHCLEKSLPPLNSVVRTWKWMFSYNEILALHCNAAPPQPDANPHRWVRCWSVAPAEPIQRPHRCDFMWNLFQVLLLS